MAKFVPTYLGGAAALTTDHVVGDPIPEADPLFTPGTEDLAAGEIRVTILGSGNPWVTKSQAAGSVLVEVGNAERDVFVLDLGSGSLANFSTLLVPVTSLTKVFFTHLHADHIADYLTLVGSYTKAGRLDPLEVWGGASDVEERGLAAFVDHIDQALAWDLASIEGYVPTTGAGVTATEVPFDRTDVIYERNGVAITSFPVIHALNGAVGYRVDYAGQSIVFSGDTLPTKNVVSVAQGCDLLIHETFLPPRAFAELMNIPIEQATAVINGAHTSAEAAGVVFSMVQPRMAAMWHCLVMDGYIEPVFEDVRKMYAGPLTLSQDLTVFNVRSDSISVRQTVVDPVASSVTGPSHTERTLGAPNPPPDWWAGAAIDWQSAMADNRR